MNEDQKDLSKFYPENSPLSTTDTMNSSASRAMFEIQGQVVMAKKFPRNEVEAEKRILVSCSRVGLAKHAQYGYPKAGKVISGPSIRLAEELARAWGNLDYGVRELTRDTVKNESLFEAYSWDLEANLRISKTYVVPHKFKSGSVMKDLEDPRDIYELGANMGSRRVRSCILAVIPKDIVDTAVMACERTLAGGESGKPFPDRVKELVIAFDKQSQVSIRMIEEFIGNTIKEMSYEQFSDLYKIFVSLKEKITKRDDWFKDKPASGLGDAPPVNDKPELKEEKKEAITNNEKVFEAEVEIEDDPAPDPKSREEYLANKAKEKEEKKTVKNSTFRLG